MDAASLIYPRYASSVGRPWGAAAIVYSIAFIVVVERMVRVRGQEADRADAATGSWTPSEWKAA
jgi:hypothetical protein